MAFCVEEIRKAEDSSRFDYDSLEREARVLVQQQTSKIQSLMRRTAQNIIEIGHRLKEVKAQLGHGEFQSWLHSEFELSISAANKFMQVHEYFKNVNFTNLQIAPSALYLLAAPSTPSGARHEALRRASQGENITHSKAKTIVRDCKATTQRSAGTSSGACVTPAQSSQRQTIDVSAQTTEEVWERPQAIRIKANAQERLFRLWVGNFGSIIRLYRADELEGSEELKVGATVIIKEGYLQGQIAQIQEVLRNEPIGMGSDEEETNQIEREEPERAEERQVEISYAGIRVAIKGCLEDLTTFCEQMQSNPKFAQEIIMQVNSCKRNNEPE